MKVLYAGSPDIAVPLLEVLAAEHQVRVLTNPDRPSGRGRKLSPNPVKAKALDLGLPVDQPERLGSHYRESLASWKPEILVSFAYGKIFGPKFLALFPQGGVNVHPSLLPRHRGPSPIPAAILAGDPKTGISIQKLALAMDSGDILVQETWPMNGQETTLSLSEQAAHRGASLVQEVLRKWPAYSDAAQPQNGAEATYCGLIPKDAGLVDWRESAQVIHRMIRAYNPWPRAYTNYGQQKLSLLEGSWSEENLLGQDGDPLPPGTVAGVDKKKGILIQTNEGHLRMTRLQLTARKAMDHLSFLNGNRDFLGAVLGEPHE
jgi:methionyl-tRNA formyltransferase